MKIKFFFAILILISITMASCDASIEDEGLYNGEQPNTQGIDKKEIKDQDT